MGDLFALTKAKEFNLYQIFLLTNFLKVVRSIEGNKDWILRIFVLDIRDLMKIFASIKIHYLFRASNVAVEYFCLFSGLAVLCFFFLLL